MVKKYHRKVGKDSSNPKCLIFHLQIPLKKVPGILNIVHACLCNSLGFFWQGKEDLVFIVSDQSKHWPTFYSDEVFSKSKDLNSSTENIDEMIKKLWLVHHGCLFSYENIC